jgi:hypothetical protein
MAEASKSVSAGGGRKKGVAAWNGYEGLSANAHSFSDGMTVLGGVPPTDRTDLVPWLAERKIVPVRNSRSDGRYTLRRRGPKVPMSTRERRQVVRRLAIRSDAECGRLRERIKAHPSWGLHA